jgi:3D (Asp-Asp-Asp) domain-containing protein
MRWLLTMLLVCAPLAARTARPHHRHTHYHVQATAFCLHGTTAAGTRSRLGTVAADPSFLPIGSRIRVRDAGAYSGTYVVTDTGSKIIGRHIDLRVQTTAAARRFGKRVVWIQVLKWGNGEVAGD